jgi:hypothetical protein
MKFKNEYFGSKVRMPRVGNMIYDENAQSPKTENDEILMKF